jgi:hypothetical protein
LLPALSSDLLACCRSDKLDEKQKEKSNQFELRIQELSTAFPHGDEGFKKKSAQEVPTIIMQLHLETFQQRALCSQLIGFRHLYVSLSSKLI